MDVTDVNEHAPTFTARQYNGMLFENAPVGTSASVTVLANDTDLLQANRNIMYNITAGNTMDSFVIGAKVSTTSQMGSGKRAIFNRIIGKRNGREYKKFDIEASCLPSFSSRSGS